MESQGRIVVQLIAVIGISILVRASYIKRFELFTYCESAKMTISIQYGDDFIADYLDLATAHTRMNKPPRTNETDKEFPRGARPPHVG